MTDPRRHTGPDAAPPTPPPPSGGEHGHGGGDALCGSGTPPSERERRPLPPWRGAWRAALTAVAVLLVVLLLTLGAGTAFLRSAPGEAWLTAQAVRLLAAAGITATLDGLEGPLPERLLLRNLTLSDGRGLWLHVDEAEVRLRLSALLRGTLDVELLRVAAPRWERMPELPVAERPERDAGAGFDPLALPLRVRLGQLDVRHAVLGADLLGRRLAFSLRGALDAPAGAVSARMNLDREPLDADAIPAMSGASTSVPIGSSNGSPAQSSAVNDHGATPLGGLALALSYTARTGDLQLDAAGGEDAGGLLGCLIGQPDLPAYGLRLAGHGSQGRWRGWFAASAGDLLRLDGEAEGELDASAPGIAAWLAGRKDSIWRADLQLTARSGADTPAALRRWMGATASPGASRTPGVPGTGLTLRAQASGTHGRTGMTLDVPLLALDGGAWNLELADATLHAAGTANAPMNLRATIRARADDAAVLLPAAPLRAAEATLTVNGSLNAPDGDALALRGRIDLHDVPAAAHADIGVDMDGNLHRAGQHLVVDGLRLPLNESPLAADGLQPAAAAAAAADHGKAAGGTAMQPTTAAPHPAPLAVLTSNGAWDAATRHATANLAAELPDLTRLPYLAYLADLLTRPTPSAPTPTASRPGATPGASGRDRPVASPLQAGGARLEADIDLRLPPESSAAEPAAATPGLSVALRAQGADLRWNSPHARYLLGPAPSLSAEVHGGYAAPLRLELRGITTARLSGRGTASLAASAPQGSDAPGLLPPFSATSLLDASARLTLTGLNGLLSATSLNPDRNTRQTPQRAASGDSDTLTLDLDAKGALAAPTARLAATLPYLQLPMGAVRGLTARLDADLRLLPDSPVATSRAAAPAGIGRTTSTPTSASPVLAGLVGLGGLGGLGGLDISATDALGSPLAVTARWGVEQRGDARNAQLDITRAEGAGLRGLASLAASWNDVRNARDTMPATLSGTANMAVADWSALSRVAGATLSGDNARLRIWLGTEDAHPPRADAGETAIASAAPQKTALRPATRPTPGPGQRGTVSAFRTAPRAAAIPLHAEATASRLTVGGAAMLNALSLTLHLPNVWDVRDMQPTPNGTARLRTGSGTAAGLAWDAADAALDLRDGGVATPGATFGLTLRGRSTADVRGGYDAAAQTLRLETLHIADTAHAATVNMTRPANIQLVDGVRVDGLHLALSATPPALSPTRLPATPRTRQAVPSAQQHGDATGRPTATPLSAAAPATGTLDISLDLHRGDDAKAVAPTTTLDAALADVPLRVLRLAADLPLPEGRISGSASLRGQGGSGNGTFLLEADDVAYPDPGQTPAAFRLSGVIRPAARESEARSPATAPDAGVLHATLSAEGLQADVAEADATLPVRFAAGLPGPDLAGDMAADIRWRGPVAPVWRFVPLADRRLTGTGSLTATLRGPIAAPRVEAEAFLCGGRYEDLVSGVLLTDIQMDAQHENDGTLSIRARLGDGRGGAAAFEGRLSPPPNADTATVDSPDAPPTPIARRDPARDIAPRINLHGQLLRLSPLHRDDLSLTLSGGVEINGPLTAPLVRADITVPEGELRLLRGLGGGVTTLEVTEKSTAPTSIPAQASAPTGTLPPDAPAAAKAATPSTPVGGPRLDLRIVAPQRFFIRGRGLDSEWKGDLRVSGPAASPALAGALWPVRGRFDLLAKPFSLSRGSIAFTGEQPPNPALGLDLTNEGTSVTAVAHVGGTARRPALTLSSTPALPQDEVMSYVLFGKPLTELSRFEALQAANALRTLSGAGGDFDVLTSVRRTLGVDVLRVGSADPARQRTTTAPRDPSLSRTSAAQGTQGASGTNEQARPTLEAGKYLLDNVYVGVEQGAEPGSTGARVEVELLPRVNLEGRSSPTSSELGIMWKKDY